MSGGVDSTVTASLLQEQGFDVHGFFMLLPVEEKEKQQKKAQQIAADLGIPLTCIDLQDEFRHSVINYFLQSYQAGLTPNPCIYCNAHIKLGLFLRIMLSSGMDKVATGHYAEIHSHNGQPTLFRSADPKKDQSYFLCRLNTKQLSRLIFPLSNWQKTETYIKAESLGFDFSGQESQDVCFLPSDLASFLTANGLDDNPGNIVTTEGKIIGTHTGLWRYTIGQRRGLGLPDTTPWYVTALDTDRNTLVVGKQDKLLSKRLIVHALKWHPKPSLFPYQCNIQLRSRHTPAKARIIPTGKNCAQIVFSRNQRAITPGQYAAFYAGNRLVGSGIIKVDYK